MAETTMPATEAKENMLDERQSYEFAFHVLPTVAEGEVTGVFDEIKAHIAEKGEIFDEEAPERIDLEYAIVKSLDGKNRKFTSAYFGWVRFKAEASDVEAIMSEIDGMAHMLRSLIVKLTAVEEAHPFRFHEYRKSQKMVEVIDEETLGEAQTETEEKADVSDKELDKSLEKITDDETSKESSNEDNKNDEE